MDTVLDVDTQVAPMKISAKNPRHYAFLIYFWREVEGRNERWKGLMNMGIWVVDKGEGSDLELAVWCFIYHFITGSDLELPPGFDQDILD